MNDKIKELLSVLDLPEREQSCWAIRKYPKYLARYPQSSLADLAFKLKDGLDWKSFAAACEIVRVFWCNLTWNVRKNLYEEKQKHIPNGKFWKSIAEPIDWIIAALIAKELK